MFKLIIMRVNRVASGACNVCLLYTSVGEMIRYALDECGKSQAELARELNLSASRISDFVNDRSEPSLRVAGEICRLLDISPQMMLGV